MSSEEHVSIEGTLLMLDDATPHVAVPVQAVSNGEVVATTLSDKGGRYQLTGLKSGPYHVRCQVLCGYVYYGQKEEAQDGLGKCLYAESGKILKNIDFCFAPFKKGTWRSYGTVDGLVHNTVISICRDSDGIMWFGSDYGVSRYDGREFVNFTPEDGLAGLLVSSIHEDPDGVMWFATLGGVSRYDGKEFTSFTTRDGLVNNHVRSIYRDLGGVMWFGTAGGISRYDGRRFHNLTTEDGLVSNSVMAIYGDQDGVMWFGAEGGVSLYDGREFVNLTSNDGLAPYRINAICGDLEGGIWLAGARPWSGEGGLSRYDGRGFRNFTMADGLTTNAVLAIHRDSDGVMWFGTYMGGVSRYDGQTFVNFTKEDGLANNIVASIFRDPDDVMWFGTGGMDTFERGGVSRYDEHGLVSYTRADGLSDDRVLCIHCDPDRLMWLGTWNGGVSLFDGKEFVGRLTTEDGLADNWVRAIYTDPDGVVWLATGVGISQYDGKEVANLSIDDGLFGSWVRAIHRDPDGVMWFAARGGVLRYDGASFARFTTQDGLMSNNVWDVKGDQDGKIWFACWGGGVSRYDGKEFVNFTIEDGLPSRFVFDIYPEPNGILWFGTRGDGGASRYDGKTFTNFSTKDGLTSKNIIDIYRDKDGGIWFATDGGGVCQYDGVSWTSLDTRDGLAGDTAIAIYQSSDGDLWFATSDGITRYRRSMVPPKVNIVSVTTDQTYGDLSAIPAFTPEARVTIKCDAIDLKTVPEKRQYRCRIREIDSEWRKPTKSDTFDLVFNEPGTYTFDVQAIDRDLNYSEPASVELEVIADPRNHRIIQLEEHIRQQELAELERVYQDLEDARQIQLSLLPKESPQIAGYEIAGTSLPAKEISGDFYSYLSLEDNTGIVLADVTGKSVKAAMVATLADGMLNEATKSRKELWNSPGMILSELNMGLQPRLMRGMFVAMSLGILQTDEKRLTFSNSGMPYPIVKRGDEVRELEVNGLPLGLVSGVEYDDMTFEIEPGDFLVFYSDGVIEATDEAGEMYETERLLEVVQEASSALSAQEMLELIVSDVTAYVGDEEASDDITIVALRCVE